MNDVTANRDGVHQRHCCPDCGCKYGDEDCPVALHQLPPQYGCWECDERYADIRTSVLMMAPIKRKQLLADINDSLKDE